MNSSSPACARSNPASTVRGAGECVNSRSSGRVPCGLIGVNKQAGSETLFCLKQKALGSMGYDATTKACDGFVATGIIVNNGTLFSRPGVMAAVRMTAMSPLPRFKTSA